MTGRVVSGDYNGDGKDDIAAFYEYGSFETGVSVWLSNGNSFVYQGDNGWWRSDGYSASRVTYRIVSTDFNDDGKDDIAAFYDYGNNTTRIHVWISSGTEFQYQWSNGWWSSNIGAYTASSITGRVVAGDYNGDGKGDISTLYNYGNGYLRIHVWISLEETFIPPKTEGWWNNYEESKPLLSIQYQYDRNNELIKVLRNGQVVIEFNYDDNGNLKSIQRIIP
jgi:YD repeat-containing protein